MKLVTRDDVKNIKVGDKFVWHPTNMNKNKYFATVKQVCTNHFVVEVKAVEMGFFGDPIPYMSSIRKLDIGFDEVLEYA